jgi:hypothetical protein
MLLFYALPLGVLGGLAAGGAFSHLATVRIRFAALAVAGLLFQAALFSPPIASWLGATSLVGPVLYVASTCLVLAVLLANLGQPGFRLVLAGAALNLLAVVANSGHMPASPAAWAALHGSAGLPAGVLTNSVLANSGTLFAWLGDVFYLPAGLPLANVFSIGDVLIAAGGAWFIARAMSGRSARPAPAQATASANG